MLLPTTPLNQATADDVNSLHSTEAVRYDEPFLTRLRQRDSKAFDLMLADQSRRIQRLVTRLLGWESDCEDVVQEVFVAAWEKIDRFRGDAILTSWLYAIAINQCRKHRRRRGRWRTVFENSDDRPLEEYPIRKSGKNEHSASHDFETIYRALNQLPHKDREIIVLCSLDNKTLDEAGTILKVRKNTAEVRLHRARRKLKQILSTTEVNE